MSTLSEALHKLKDRIGVMPKTVCVVGATALPPVGMALFLALITAIYYSYQAIAPLLWGPPMPSVPRELSDRDRFTMKYGPFIILGFWAFALWVIAALQAYIHCYLFWHEEKPEWAKSDNDRAVDFEINFMDCPECEEAEPDEWHQVGECLHFGTTP